MSLLNDLVAGLVVAGVLLVVGGVFSMAAGTFEKDAPGWLSALAGSFVYSGIIVAAWAPIVALIVWVVS